MKSNYFKHSLGLFVALTLSHQVAAQLTPMDDTDLEGTVGQAYIEMDSYTDTNSFLVSRITFGQDVKVQANADALILGNIGGDADFSASNLSLGYIDTSTNTIVPFTFTNPYLEWVTDATNNVIGFRLGAEEALGILQMDMSSFSGNIGMKINGVDTSLFDGLAGSITNNRAKYIGTNAGGCADSTSCVALGNVQSLSVADTDGSSTADFFLAFQKTAMSWNTSSGTQAASSGFFMNVPTDTNLTVSNAASSTGRLATEFIDRGVGRWNVAPTP